MADRAVISREELWRRTAEALDRGDFSLLDDLLTAHNASIIDLLNENSASADNVNEAFTWTCFTGRTREAEMLLDRGVDPAVGTKTGLAGAHWAANRGNLDTVRMLIGRGVPLEQLNMYEGTVLGCTLYSAVHEHRHSHADIVDALIDSGARVHAWMQEWWEEQNVPSPETKRRVAAALSRGQIA